MNDYMNKGKIKFQIETKRVLELLSSEIYDSPYALLRENIQNAYDAILMRKAHEEDKWDIDEGLINISINNKQIVISDNGIGMNEDILKNNFWKAGSSGKKSDLAKKAGVIGTFGIGAMANFGICTKLRVETKMIESDITIISEGERETLSVTDECIFYEVVKDNRAPGTTIIATIQENSSLSFDQAIKYLESYTKYIPVKVILNGILISQSDYKKDLISNSDAMIKCEVKRVTNGIYSMEICNTFDPSSGFATVYVSNIKVQDKEISGEMLLLQRAGMLMGLRNYFGLAPIPIGQYYQFGGFVNLSVLQPTAGREALSRESISLVNTLISIIELEVSNNIATLDVSDKNSDFINHILSIGKINLASNITILVEPGQERIKLGQIDELTKSKKTYYYSGNDKDIVQTYGSSETLLLLVGQNNPRRQLHQQYLTRIGIEQIEDKVQVTKLFDKMELTFEEIALEIRMTTILQDDYSLNNVKVYYAVITHCVPYMVEENKGVINIYLARNSHTILPLLQCYKTAIEVFQGFVKDFIRTNLYPRLTNFIPSASRQGTEAFLKIMRQNKEIYSYEADDIGGFESIISDYLAGKVTFPELIKTSKAIYNKQSVTVSVDQVGSVENEIPDIVNSPIVPDNINNELSQEYQAMPPIFRSDIDTKMKILTVHNEYPLLNNFKTFLALSDRVFDHEYDFFTSPHESKVIWGSHRVIYIFTHGSSRLTFYYDIELKEPIKETNTGGLTFPTTTLVTNKRIFIPIPNILASSFVISEGSKEFFVRYDIILE